MIEIQKTGTRAAAAKRIAFALSLGLALVASPALGRDVYKNYLDPGLAHHKAIVQVLEQLRDNPNDAGLKNDLACLIAWDGFWRDALREFDEASKLDKKFAKPAYNAGLVRAWKGEWGGAASSFKDAVNRDPGNWPAWWMLGFCYEMQDKFDAATDAYKTSLRVDTSLFDPRVNPFALHSRLKTRVLLETYEKRMIRSVLPTTEQFAEATTLSTALQRTRPVPTISAGAAATAAAAAAAAAAEETAAPSAGRAISVAAPSSTTSGSGPGVPAQRPPAGRRVNPPTAYPPPAPAPQAPAPAPTPVPAPVPQEAAPNAPGAPGGPGGPGGPGFFPAPGPQPTPSTTTQPQ